MMMRPTPHLMNEEFDMKRRTGLFVAVAVAMGVTSAAMANGGRGGDSGDSSMNPFTGDSYAYFHGGHNLGEEGTIRPNRVPAKPNVAQDAKRPAAPSSATRPAKQLPDTVGTVVPDRQVGQ
jgi:hypothetical protein